MKLIIKTNFKKFVYRGVTKWSVHTDDSNSTFEVRRLGRSPVKLVVPDGTIKWIREK